MRRSKRLHRGERADFVLTMDDVFVLFELARTLDPDEFPEADARALIYSAKTMDVGESYSMRVVP